METVKVTERWQKSGNADHVLHTIHIGDKLHTSELVPVSMAPVKLKYTGNEWEQPNDR